MAAAKKRVAVYLVVVAVLVAAHFIFSPLYAEVLDAVDGWRVLNWFMAVGVLVMLAFHYRRKREHDAAHPHGQVTRRYLEVNVMLFVSLLIGILFFWNWVDSLALEAGKEQGSSHRVIWTFIDSALPVALGVTASQMWRD